MMKRLFLVFVLLAVISCAVSAENKIEGGTAATGVTLPVPPAGHPRLYVTPDDIEDVKSRMQSAEGRKILAKLEKAALPRTAAEEAAEKDRGFRYYFKMRGLTSKVQLQALDYLVNGDKAVAREAITSMLDSLKNTNFGTKNDLSRASGVMLMVGGMVYDWCYDQFTPAERQAYIKEFVRIAGTMECHYPPKRTEPIAGHSSEWMILRDMLSCGIAIYDEYPEMYNYVVEMLFEDYFPVRNYVYKGQNYHQGTSYITVRFSNDLISQWIFRKMGVEGIYDPGMQYVLYDFIYRRRPDGHVIPAGDVNPGNRKKPNSYDLPAMLASAYYNDPYLDYEYKTYKPNLEPHCLMFELLWRNFDLQPKSPEDLPLTRYSGTPFGWMIARTGWGDDSVIAEMKVNEQFVGNHQHLDGGSFQLYYKGLLAIDSGSYQGSAGGYNSPHNKNYFKRTIAHNSLLIFDPEEKFACWNYGGSDKTEYAANDGGQRMPGDRWDTCRSFKDLLSESYTMGKALAHGFGPDPKVPEYSYLKGDLTKAYTAKVKDVRRSFVFLNLKDAGDAAVPAALIVYDHIEASNPDFQKYWLLHSVEEPELAEDEFTVTRCNEYGDEGMLKNTVLLPETAKMEKVGGRGREFWVFNQKTGETEGGTNYPNDATTRPDPTNERGEWRLEIKPAKGSAVDNFLNVMQVADAGNEDWNTAVRVDAEKVVGTAIADRVVMFSRDAKTLGETFEFSVLNTSAEYKVLLTDLAEGRWKVYRDRKLVGRFDVDAGSGTLYFKAKGGSYTIEK